MKAAPLLRELKKRPDKFKASLIHTGQHYDPKMSKLFFDDLKMAEPDIYLGIGSGTHAEQTGKIMIELERIFAQQRPDMVVVFGDVNSTMAGAICAAKMVIPVAHVEAGLRSFDHAMPEEINRIVTDRLSSVLFTSEPSGAKNLLKEGVESDKIYHVGNIMIDSLVASLELAASADILERIGIRKGEYACMTLHRPSNVDNPDNLRALMNMVSNITSKLPIVFPCHPRTRKEMAALSNSPEPAGLKLIEPLGYIDFLRLQSSAKFVLTDSGGIQEETTYLGIPCITMRESTERPVTVDVGTNILTGPDPEKVLEVIDDILAGKAKKGRIPEFWDGQTAVRIADTLEKVSNLRP